MEKARLRKSVIIKAETIAVACLGLLYLNGCAQEQKTAEGTKSSQVTTSTATSDTVRPKPADSASEPKASGQTSEAAVSGSGTDSATKGEAATPKTKSSESSGQNKNSSQTDKADNTSPTATPEKSKMTLSGDLPEIESASKKVNLAKMADTLIICTVKGSPITVGQYRQEFKQRQQKTQAYLSVSQPLEESLLAEAKRRNITLSKEETNKLIDTTRKAKQVAGKAINNFLDKSDLSAKQFDEKVLRLGLALKTSQAATRDLLLNELVDQELMVGAARAKGYYSAAFNKFVELKKSPEYKQLLLETGLDPSSAQTQVINRELITMFVKDMQKTVSVSDTEVQEAYDSLKDRLKHGDLYRISQIVIAAPSTDTANAESLKTQLKKQYPKDTPKELADRASKVDAEQKKKAEDLLAQLNKGADFAQLANKNTDDPMNKQSQNGGDIGFKDKAALQPDFLKKLNTLKVGQVYPEVMKTEYGYHIVKLTDQKPAGTVPLSEVKDALKDKLLQQKQTLAVFNWLKDQHKTAEIKVSPEFQKLAASLPAPEVKLQ